MKSGSFRTLVIRLQVWKKHCTEQIWWEVTEPLKLPFSIIIITHTPMCRCFHMHYMLPLPYVWGRLLSLFYVNHSYPWWLRWYKEPACNTGATGLIPGLGRSPGGGNGSPLQYSSLRYCMDGGAWRATIHGVAKTSDTT